MATGLGSPDAAQLAAGLCAASARARNPGTLSSTVGSPVTVQLAPGAHPPAVSYSAQGLPPGLRIAGSSGTVTGTPSRTGRYVVKLQATGPASDQQTTTFTWLITGPPKLSRVSLSRVASGSARLAFVVSSARGGPALSGLNVNVPARMVIGFGGSLSVTGAHGAKLTFSTVRKGATIDISLSSPTPTATVAAALTASPAFRNSVRRGQRPVVSISVTTTNASGGTDTLRSRTRPTS
jgi:Putative Ig domain